MKNGFAKICHCRGHIRVSTGNPGLNKDVADHKVILKGCNSGSQPYKRQSGRDAETLRAAALLSMTLLNKGFTLIELLVVVLIIGILAALAVPQYQKAVEKSRAVQALTLLKTLHQAEKTYYLENGRYATHFEDLAVDMAWSGAKQWGSYGITDTRSNDLWSVQIFQDMPSQTALFVGRLNGAYRGGGFVLWLKTPTGSLQPIVQHIACVERRGAGVSFQKEEGSYCKIFGGKNPFKQGSLNYYFIS